MRLEKIKLKIANGHTDEEVAAMAGISVEEVVKLRTPASTPKPAPKAASKKAATSKKKK